MTAFPSYKTGTISIDAGATLVIGVGAIFNGTNARPGDTLRVAGNPPVDIVDATTDLTQLVIDPWPYAAVVNQPYKITQNSPLRFAGGSAMADVTRIVNTMNTDGFYVFVPDDESVPDPSSGDDGQYARKPTTQEEWLKDGGVWVFQGVFGSLSATSDPWNILTNYTKDIIVPFAGKLWRSLVPNNLGNQPDINPTDWALFLSGGDTVFIPMDDSDRPATGEQVLKFQAPKTITFNAALSDSTANANVGATLDAIYSIQKNGVEFATLKFAAGGQGGPQNGVFTCAATVVFAFKDILTMVAPNPRDATLFGIGICLTGYRS